MSVRSPAIRLVMALFLVSSAACAAAPRARPVEGGPVDTGKGTLTAARQYLEGRWTLESFEVFSPGRAPVVLKGQGTLTYDASGNLQMDIRADEKSADLLRASGIEIRDNMISTGGRTVVDMQHRTISFIVDGGGFATTASGPLALNRPRYWEAEADRLTLTTRDADGKPLSIGRWRRMP
jgi:hypothetical protein